MPSTYILEGHMYQYLYGAELGIINTLPFYNISEQQSIHSSTKYFHQPI